LMYGTELPKPHNLVPLAKDTDCEVNDLAAALDNDAQKAYNGNVTEK